jgi:3-hexulose-6-phosphate synthase/6-phospho-3-hexuloisomerase
VGCTVQVSFDLHAVEDALAVAAVAAEAGVHWLEAGTGLVVEQGLAAVRALRARFPLHPIVADLKVCDGGAYFARIAAEAGATHLDVMAAAHEATLRGAAREGRARGLTVIADVMGCADPVAAARRAEAAGAGMIGLHLGYDHRHALEGLSPLDGLEALLAAVTSPVQVVGGLSIEQAEEAARRGARSVVIGAPLVPADRGPKLLATLREVVRRVGAIGP